MLNHFLELVQIDSESREEKDVAENLRKAAEDAGGVTRYDDAGEKIGGNVGNLFIRFEGTNPNAMPLFLSAHMDTVVPGRGVRPRVDGERVVTDGTTILGGDDKSGCALVIEVMRSLKEQQIGHGEIEVCFTIGEEKGLLGAKAFDTSGLKSKYGIVLDSDDPGLACTRAPAADRMEWIIHGKESHAGVEPEKGISAIRVAANAIAKMALGRIDAQTTANIGGIEGGSATNIITNRVRVIGEARSLDPEKLERQTHHMSRCFHAAAEATPEITINGTTYRARIDERIERDYGPMEVPDDSPVVRLLFRAARLRGVDLRTGEMGGGCDANAFNHKGLECVNFGTGMRDIHTVQEWLDLSEFYRSADLVFDTLKVNASAS